MFIADHNGSFIADHNGSFIAFNQTYISKVMGTLNVLDMQGHFDRTYNAHKFQDFGLLHHRTLGSKYAHNNLE